MKYLLYYILLEILYHVRLETINVQCPGIENTSPFKSLMCEPSRVPSKHTLQVTTDCTKCHLMYI